MRKNYLLALIVLFFVLSLAKAELKLWYQMDSADDFNLGQNIGGVAGKLYVANNATGVLTGGMTSTSGIQYNAAEGAVYMNGVHPCKISGQENGNTLFTSTTKYTFSLKAKADLSAVQGGGYSFYLWFSDGSQFKCDLSYKADSAFTFSSPGGDWQNNASNIWNTDPAYAYRYVDPETWNTYSATWDAENNVISTYVNGIERGSWTGGDVPAIATGATVTDFGFGDGYGWSSPGGWYKDFRIYDTVLTSEELYKISRKNPQFAYYPNPADGMVLPGRQMPLSWLVADGAQGHEIYLGTDYEIVNSADPNSDVFMGSFDLGQTEFYPSYLHAGRQYYWRVDEILDGQAVKGEVWSFMTVKNNIDLYLFMGQSNMCVSVDVNPEDNIPDVHIIRFDKRDSQWKLLDANDIDGIGPAPSFAVGMIADREDTVVGIVHTAVGGTSQSRWLKGGDLYEATMNRAREAMQYGAMRGVLWHQGESEAGNNTKARNYGANLKKMINDIRNDLEISDLPFVLGKLGDFNTQKYKNTINSGIEATANSLSNVKVASPSGLTCWDDNIHFTSDSQRIYGFRYAAKMMEMVGPRTTTADVDSDGNVDLIDLGLIAEKWLEFSNYDDSKDINNDGHIDIYDFVIMSGQWGQ